MRLDGEEITVYTRPSAPRQQLAVLTLEPGERRTVTLETYVPGLITAGAHLLLETTQP
jgi:hypothetical protein